MIIIGICDGEQTIRSLLASYVERYRLQFDVEIQLLAYSTGEKLLKNYMLDLDLIFLEIPLWKVNGLKIAEYIKQQDSQVRIVFLTTVLSYVLEAFEVGASNYLLKHLSYNKFCLELDKVIEEKKSTQKKAFLIQNKQGLYKVYFNEIHFIETCGKNTLIHTRNEDILNNKQMKWYEQLFQGTSLVRCHAGYIVNLHYFQRIEAGMIVLIDGTKIPVSRSQKQKILTNIERLFGEENE